MNLPKATRRKLYEAKGPLWIEWPEGLDPHPGKRYAVHSEEDGSRLFSVRVEKTRERGEEARVKIDNDPVRVLPGLPGTHNEQGDYESEPERVSAEYEDKLCLEASAPTAMLGAAHRDVQGALDSKKQGKQARERVARAQKRLEEVA
jgi:hypothetical protein